MWLRGLGIRVSGIGESFPKLQLTKSRTRMLGPGCFCEAQTIPTSCGAVGTLPHRAPMQMTPRSATSGINDMHTPSSSYSCSCSMHEWPLYSSGQTFRNTACEFASAPLSETPTCLVGFSKRGRP